MKHIRQLAVALVVVMVAALLVAPTFAQDNTPTPAAPTTNSANAPRRPLGGLVSSLTLTITQDDINTRLSNRPGKLLQDASVVLGDGQITVSFTTKGQKDGGQGKAVVAVVTPGVENGKIKWTFDSVTIDGTAATQDQIDMFKQRVSDLVGGRLGNRERRFSVTDVTVTSEAITISLTRNKSA